MKPIILAPKPNYFADISRHKLIYLNIVAYEHFPLKITLKITTPLPKIGSQRLAYPTIFLQSMFPRKCVFFQLRKIKTKCQRQQQNFIKGKINQQLRYPSNKHPITLFNWPLDWNCSDLI